MGDLIELTDRLADPSRHTSNRAPAFFFDVACPFSYLAAERIERVLGEVAWVPTARFVLESAAPSHDPDVLRALAEERARALRLPLVWPERFPEPCPRALRAAAHASEIGAGAQFALAATRMAFCGGFDIEETDVLAEAAAAAGMPVRACLSAAGDVTRDEALHATARALQLRGVRRLPALRVHRRWFVGERALGEGAALLAARAL